MVFDDVSSPVANAIADLNLLLPVDDDPFVLVAGVVALDWSASFDSPVRLRVIRIGGGAGVKIGAADELGVGGATLARSEMRSEYCAIRFMSAASAASSSESEPEPEPEEEEETMFSFMYDGGIDP